MRATANTRAGRPYYCHLAIVALSSIPGITSLCVVFRSLRYSFGEWRSCPCGSPPLNNARLALNRSRSCIMHLLWHVNCRTEYIACIVLAYVESACRGIGVSISRITPHRSIALLNTASFTYPMHSLIPDIAARLWMLCLPVLCGMAIRVRRSFNRSA